MLIYTFNAVYREPGSGELLTGERDALLADFMAELDSSEMHRRGFVSALGAFPAFALRGKVRKVKGDTGWPVRLIIKAFVDIKIKFL